MGEVNKAKKNIVPVVCISLVAIATVISLLVLNNRISCSSKKKTVIISEELKLAMDEADSDKWFAVQVHPAGTASEEDTYEKIIENSDVVEAEENNVFYATKEQILKLTAPEEYEAELSLAASQKAVENLASRSLIENYEHESIYLKIYLKKDYRNHVKDFAKDFKLIIFTISNFVDEENGTFQEELSKEAAIKMLMDERVQWMEVLPYPPAVEDY